MVRSFNVVLPDLVLGLVLEFGRSFGTEVGQPEPSN